MAAISQLKNIFRDAFKIFWVTEYLLIFRDKIDPGIFFHYIPCFCGYKVRFLKNLTRNIAYSVFWETMRNGLKQRTKTNVDSEIAKYAEKYSA